jgi:hypothetical protein
VTYSVEQTRTSSPEGVSSLHIQLKSLFGFKLAPPHSVSAWMDCTWSPALQLVRPMSSCSRVGQGYFICLHKASAIGLVGVAGGRQLCASSAVKVGVPSVVAAGRMVGAPAASVVVARRPAAAVLLRPSWSGSGSASAAAPLEPLISRSTNIPYIIPYLGDIKKEYICEMERKQSNVWQIVEA